MYYPCLAYLLVNMLVWLKGFHTLVLPDSKLFSEFLFNLLSYRNRLIIITGNCHPLASICGDFIGPLHEKQLSLICHKHCYDSAFPLICEVNPTIRELLFCFREFNNLFWDRGRIHG